MTLLGYFLLSLSHQHYQHLHHLHHQNSAENSAQKNVVVNQGYLSLQR